MEDNHSITAITQTNSLTSGPPPKRARNQPNRAHLPAVPILGHPGKTLTWGKGAIEGCITARMEHFFQQIEGAPSLCCCGLHGKKELRPSDYKWRANSFKDYHLRLYAATESFLGNYKRHPLHQEIALAKATPAEKELTYSSDRVDKILEDTSARLSQTDVEALVYQSRTFVPLFRIFFGKGIHIQLWWRKRECEYTNMDLLVLRSSVYAMEREETLAYTMHPTQGRKVRGVIPKGPNWEHEQVLQKNNTA